MMPVVTDVVYKPEKSDDDVDGIDGAVDRV